MTLCEKLTQARKAAGLTQADIAARLSVSRQAVSRWESGQSKPSTEKPAVETTSDEPEAVPVETVISEKHRPQAWLKYMVAALCGALLMLALLLILKKPDSSEKSVDVKRFTDLEVDHVGDITKQDEGFDFTWK